MNKFKKIITINTINQNIELLLQNDNVLIDKEIIDANNSHAEILVVSIENFLKKNNIAYLDLDFISIVNGPGSFIGLKTSISIVKAMQFALDKKIIVNNLFEIISYKKSFDYIVLQGDLISYYIEEKTHSYLKNANNPQFYIKKNEINRFLDNNINYKLITNSQNIAEELNKYKISVEEYNTDNLVALNFEKYINNKFEKHLEALYIKPPQVTIKKNN